MRLYIGNISYKMTEGDLADWFAEAGIAVDSVTLSRDKFSGESRGFGFAEINDDEAANQAIAACNGRECMGRNLVVNEARPMRERPPRGGGDRGERGGRSRN